MKPFTSTIVANALIGAVAGHGAEELDPRAIGFSIESAINEKAEPHFYRRSETTYSIVMYGDDYRRRPNREIPSYRFLGIDREFSFDEFKTILNSMYAAFPKDAKVSDPRLGGLIPLPNIIYFNGGWNEMPQTGPELAKAVSQRFGIALFYCRFNSYQIEIKETQRQGVPNYDQACRDYYLERLKLAVEQLKGKPAAESESK